MVAFFWFVRFISYPANIFLYMRTKNNKSFPFLMSKVEIKQKKWSKTCMIERRRAISRSEASFYSHIWNVQQIFRSIFNTQKKIVSHQLLHNSILLFVFDVI